MDVALAVTNYAAVESERDMSAVVQAIRESPDPGALIDALSKYPDVDIRAWIVDIAPAVLGSDEAVPVLLALAKDRDRDVRMDAINALISVSPGAAQPFAGRLRRQLSVDDMWEPIVAMWALARLRDVDSLPDLDSIASSDDSDVPGWHKTTARAAAYVIRRDEEAIVTWLLNSDDIARPAVIHAAEMMDTYATIAALASLRERDAEP